MSGSLSVDGDLAVRETLESREIVAQLEAHRFFLDNELTVDKSVVGVLTLHISAFAYCGSTTVEEIEDLLLSLGPYAVEAACLACEDGMNEKYDLWIGSKEAVGQARRQREVAEVTELLKQLEPEDLTKVLAGLGVNLRARLVPGKCAQNDCGQPATETVYDKRNDAWLSCCELHAQQILDQDDPEYVVGCPNCGCRVAVN